MSLHLVTHLQDPDEPDVFDEDEDLDEDDEDYEDEDDEEETEEGWQVAARIPEPSLTA